jgi:hypothetical protein
MDIVQNNNTGLLYLSVRLCIFIYSKQVTRSDTANAELSTKYMQCLVNSMATSLEGHL